MDYQFRRFPWVTLIALFLAGAGYGLEQWLGGAPASTDLRWLYGLFSSRNAVTLVITLLFLCLLGGVLEDVLGRARFALAYALSLAWGVGLFLAAARCLGADDVALSGAGQMGAATALLGMALVRTYRLRLRAAWVLVAPRASRSEVTSLPLVAMAPLWFIPSVGWAAAADFNPTLSAHLVAQVTALICGALVALALEFRQEAALEYLMDEAERLVQVGHMRAAADRLERALRIQCNNPKVRRSLAECYAAIGQRERAQRYFLNALQAYLQQENRAEAVRTYARFRYLMPLAALEPGLELQMAGLLRSYKWHDEAIRALERVQERGKGPEAQAALLQASDAYCSMGQPARAMMLLERARSQFPELHLSAAISQGMQRCERLMASRS